MSGISTRKLRHIRISLEEDVESSTPAGFRDLKLVHRAIPEIDLSDVKTDVTLFGKKLKAPLIISAITGGTSEAKRINKTLALVAEEKGIGIGVGSQRIAVEHPEVMDTFDIVRQQAPTTLVLGNLGCPQLSLGWGPAEAEKCVEMIDADALCIHMNPLQEAVQVGGDTNYRGILDKVGEVTAALKVPVVMKETGCGVSGEDAALLEAKGVAGIEIAGVGGTSWSAVEYYIAKEEDIKDQAYLGKKLWNWGIPTAASLIEVTQETGLTVISSGGVRTGQDVAKSLAVGASAAGVARPALVEAVKGREALGRYIDNIVNELRVTMFLQGATCVEDMQKVPVLVTGDTAEWLTLRGFSVEEYARRS